MTAKELAGRLNGCEYGNEIDDQTDGQARKDGLVVVFGYSDDNAEFRGLWNDEIGCYGGGTILVNSEGVLPPHDGGCDCQFCGYKDAVKSARAITAIRGANGFAWSYATDIPHETFDVMEDGEKFCRGIVFHVSELAKEVA